MYPELGEGSRLRYSAFISYNHKDRMWANWLLKQLERYTIPKRLHSQDSHLGILGKRLPPVFQDREELAASSDLAQSVRDALLESASLIVICSPHSARSRWVNEEIRTYIALGRRDRIQLLVVDGEARTPNLADSEDDNASFPPALLEGGGQEPLAADLRDEADGKRAAVLKLLAGLLGVGYDELRQREQARRQKRLAIITGTSAVGFVLMSGLAGLAVIARNDAIAQRDIARQKTMTAERTVEFVKSLFEVSDPSEAKGAKITAQEILDKGAVRISQSLGDEPTVKAELMTTLSQVYLGLGAYKKGDQIIRDSLRLNVDDPGVRARQLMALGDSQTRQGEYQKAIATYGEALKLARAADRGNPEFVSPILIGLGEAKSAIADYRGAEADIRTALALDIARHGNRNPAVARDLEALGLNFLTDGELAKARPLFERALQIRVPIQGIAHPRVSEDLNELGSIAYLQRDSAAAERYWLRALRSDELVLGPNHPDVAITINNVARVMLERRAFAQAYPLLQRAVVINLQQRSETHDDLAFTFANLAIAERGLNRPVEAERLFRKALMAAEMHKHRNRAPILTELADLLCERRAFPEAFAMLARAEPIMRSDYPDDPWRSAWVANTKGGCLIESGRPDEARPILIESMPDLRKRWTPLSLFGHRAEQRLNKLPQRTSSPRN
ncbi:MAG: tetratricopeptide repeat protein [Sphingomonadaceae bacterium]